MGIKDMVTLTLESGITPIRLAYDVIWTFDRSPLVLRTFLKFHTLDLGTLTYRQYRFVARRTRLGNAMVDRHIQKVFREYFDIMEVKEDVECVSIPVYARLLRGGELARMLQNAIARYPEVPREFICIELSADILYEDLADAKERIHELRELGFKIAICEVGDEFCPVFRLSEIEFDYAFVEPFSTESLDREDAERVAGSLLKFLHDLDVKVIAPDLTRVSQVSGAKALGYDGYGLDEEVADELETEARQV